MAKTFRALILGAPGSGKGTISTRIVKHFGLEHISSGDKLRHHIKQQSAFGKKVQEYMSKGKLVDDGLMVEFILQEIQLVKNKSWLLDGFPRTLAQSDALWKKQKMDCAVSLVVPFDVIIERVENRWVHLPSGRVYNLGFNEPKVKGKDDVTGEALVKREDDDPKVVAQRLEVYSKITKPVIEFFKKQGILVQFEGRTSNEIWPKVMNALVKHVPLVIKPEIYK